MKDYIDRCIQHTYAHVLSVMLLYSKCVHIHMYLLRYVGNRCLLLGQSGVVVWHNIIPAMLWLPQQIAVCRLYPFGKEIVCGV